MQVYYLTITIKWLFVLKYLTRGVPKYLGLLSLKIDIRKNKENFLYFAKTNWNIFGLYKFSLIFKDVNVLIRAPLITSFHTRVVSHNDQVWHAVFLCAPFNYFKNIYMKSFATRSPVTS